MNIKCPHRKAELYIDNISIRVALVQYLFGDMSIDQLIKWIKENLKAEK